MVWVFANMSEICGNVREALFTGGKDLNIGAFPAGVLGWPCGPRSNCSQLKVTASPSASLPEPVRVNGVLIGIVKPLAPAFTIGTVFSVAVITGHALPPPETLKLRIWS